MYFFILNIASKNEHQKHFSKCLECLFIVMIYHHSPILWGNDISLLISFFNQIVPKKNNFLATIYQNLKRIY